MFRYRAGIAWRDLPERFGPWQTVWKRHHKWSADGTWDAVLAEILTDADAAGGIDWGVSADSTTARAHQHGTNISRPATTSTKRSSYTGGAADHKNRGGRGDEPDDHALGRSRGGLTTKTHLLVDGAGRPLVVMVSPGQAGDSPALLRLLAELRVARRGPAGPARLPAWRFRVAR